MSGWKQRAWHLTPLPDETESEYLNRVDKQYFREQILETAEYWSRLGQTPDFTGKSVLDFGCGHGALSVDIALKGATEVVGVDLDLHRVDFARHNAGAEYPDLATKLSFLAQDVTKTDWPARFDYIVSKDTIEHIDDLNSVFDAFARSLKPGGLLILGFSPLYHSPHGDHTRLALPLPWLHAYLPERWALKWASRRQGRTIATVGELGLNKLTPDQFRALLKNPTFQIAFMHYNRGDNFLMPLFRALRRIPILEKYFTISIYACLVRTTTALLPRPALSGRPPPVASGREVKGITY